MAFLAACSRRRRWLRFAVLTLLSLIGTGAAAQAKVQDYQVKAIFLFNFTQFVDWPSDVFADAQKPIVIGVLGEDPFGAYLDEAINGEKVDNRPLVVRRYRRTEDIDACHVLFISRSEAGHLGQVVAQLKDRSILTVSEVDGFIQHGGMVRFITENDHIKLRINVEAAKAANLTLSSKLLRVSEVVTTDEANR